MIKLVLKGVVGLVVLMTIIIAVILVPAHWQVRSVTPDLPSKDDLLALRTTNGPSNIRYILTSSQQLERGQISHISILAEWADGKRFLIDTGMSEEGARDFAELLTTLDSSAGPATIYGTVSALLGDEIQTVDGVGFTHLHIDHTQGVDNFCSARGAGALLLQTPSQKQLHNFNTSEGAELISNSCLESGQFTLKAKQNLYQSEEFPGLAAIELGGHTPGSTLWAITLGEKVLLFSGDITNNKASIDLDQPKSALYSYMIVPENTARTAELRRWLKDLDTDDFFSVIVSHDLENTRLHLSPFLLN